MDIMWQRDSRQEMHKGVESRLHKFLISALDGGG